MTEIASMTGFGKGECTADNYKFLIEIKTVNNRYNDIHLRMPKSIRFLEEKIRNYIKTYIYRGRIDISITMEITNGTSAKIEPNIQLAFKYKDAVDKLSNALKIKNTLKIKDYLDFDDVIYMDSEDIDEDEIWKVLKEALSISKDNIQLMRKKEGSQLAKDIKNNLDLILKILHNIEENSKGNVNDYKDKLEKRITELLSEEYQIDEGRLYNELAIYADKIDINEEIIRLNSHIKQIKDTLEEGGIIGRKIDFIIQEANREINTIGSKSQDIGITKDTIEIKNLIEKIREQAQNIE